MIANVVKSQHSHQLWLKKQYAKKNKLAIF
jgi:hypothetical protein